MRLKPAAETQQVLKPQDLQPSYLNWTGNTPEQSATHIRSLAGVKTRMSILRTFTYKEKTSGLDCGALWELEWQHSWESSWRKAGCESEPTGPSAVSQQTRVSAEHAHASVALIQGHAFTRLLLHYIYFVIKLKETPLGFRYDRC